MFDMREVGSHASCYGRRGPCDWCENEVRYDAKNRVYDYSGEWVLVMCFKCRMTYVPELGPKVEDGPF